MKIEKINGALFKEMVLNGAILLARSKDELNDLNVFPVPDGDTGTNMLLTIKSAVKEMSQIDSDDISLMGEALSRGSLKGARGNSGVILSQIFRGFYSVIQGKKEITAIDLADGLDKGVATAYRAVMKPREGTILTVSRAVAEGAIEAKDDTDDIIEVMERALSDGEDMLERTPDMLDVLKQAGVVDAGGAGLLVIYRGYLSALRGEKPLGTMDDVVKESEKPIVSAASAMDMEIEFGYCTEFFVNELKENINDDDVDRFTNKLQQIGDSVVVVHDVGMIKTHVHSEMPGKVLQYAMKLGTLSDIKIENMREQHNSLHFETKEVEQKEKQKEKTNSEVVTVAAGTGLAAVFVDLGATQFVEGGQTMNPSTEDLLEAINKANADNVIILPNNSNIIMAAQQAAEIAECNVQVIPTKTIPQGVAAMLGYDLNAEIDTNAKNMESMIDDVITGQVTYAVRNSTFDGQKIKKDDIMGLVDGKISIVCNDVHECVTSTLEKMMHDDAEIITLFYGSDTTEENATKLSEELSEKYPDADVEVYFGGQPLYYYIISVE
ncbi:MAG: DAK2 domain-containing protein [Clostridiales bacterium]|nr:DAK2 domain-containing protein [Clostridiales bacterium]